MKTLAILGAGTAGTMMANKMAGLLPRDQWRTLLIDQDDVHVYQPGLLFLPFGLYNADEILKPRTRLLEPGVELNLSGIQRVDAEARTVLLGDGTPVRYDLLVVATGTRIAPEGTEGLAGPGWQKNIFDFYTLEGASALGRFLDGWEGGRLLLNVVEMPIKCPVAPLEFLFLADAFFTGRGMRDKVEITYATPLDGAFTKPKASALMGDMLAQRGVEVVTDFSASRVDSEANLLESWDGRQQPYDLLVTIPQHQGAEVIARSGLGDSAGFIPTDKHTLQSKAHPEVFALGDATDLPASKAGAVAHFQSEVLADNLLRFIEGRPLLPGFDGHANCFIETGYDKAVLIDFNYETEPLPGKFPLPGLGPFDLLKESHVNHWGKLGFKWMYWNLLLKGKELPIDHRMLMAGKWS